MSVFLSIPGRIDRMRELRQTIEAAEPIDQVRFVKACRNLADDIVAEYGDPDHEVLDEILHVGIWWTNLAHGDPERFVGLI